MMNVIPTGARQTKIFDDITFTTKSAPVPQPPTISEPEPAEFMYDLTVNSTTITIDFDDFKDQEWGYRCEIGTLPDLDDYRMIYTTDSFCAFEHLDPDTKYRVYVGTSTKGGVQVSYPIPELSNMRITTEYGEKQPSLVDTPLALLAENSTKKYEMRVGSTYVMIDFHDVPGDNPYYRCIVNTVPLQESKTLYLNDSFCAFDNLEPDTRYRIYVQERLGSELSDLIRCKFYLVLDISWPTPVTTWS